MSPYVGWLVRCSVCLSGIISSFTSHASIGALVNINSIKKLIFNALSLPHSLLSPTTVTSHLQHGPALPFPLDTLQTGSNQNQQTYVTRRFPVCVRFAFFCLVSFLTHPLSVCQFALFRHLIPAKQELIHFFRMLKKTDFVSRF